MWKKNFYVDAEDIKMSKILSFTLRMFMVYLKEVSVTPCGNYYVEIR